MSALGDIALGVMALVLWFKGFEVRFWPGQYVVFFSGTVRLILSPQLNNVYRHCWESS